MSDPIGAARMGGMGGGAGIQGTGTDGIKKYTLDLGKTSAGEGSFGDSLTQAINQVSDAQDNAADHVQRFLRGESVELHQVMAATEEAGIALDVMVELRNKVLDAYRTLINMQS